MKRKIICILVLGISVSQFLWNATFVSADEQPRGSKIFVMASMQVKLTVIRSVTEVRHGDVGLITIQGEPGVRYTIHSSYKLGGRSVSIRQWRTADSKGQATFNWVVGGDTTPGTYPITITGGGETLRLSHTVLP